MLHLRFGILGFITVFLSERFQQGINSDYRLRTAEPVLPDFFHHTFNHALQIHVNNRQIFKCPPCKVQLIVSLSLTPLVPNIPLMSIVTIRPL
jgi:hypothetical protein